MSVQSVQLNTLNTDSNKNTVKKPYLEAKGAVRTGKRVKPLPPKGHLVDDTPASGVKYFFKDIGYDIKSVKDGIVGNANDHQLGRLNDVGLRLGGIGIATYLASQTTNPKVRLMEYIGLATFLTSMSIYPKIAITAPARILHGYDTNKEYIDDQGRKKSVHQDSNYIPYDMYRGKNKGEDIDAIGDKMGIPRDIKNRHDVIKEQMRKIATQNNTLWMLTAGFATPLITALLCSGIEKYIVSPGLEKTRNARFDTLLKSALSDINETSISSGTADTSLGISIKNIVSKAEGKPVSKEDYKRILELFTEEIDSTLSEGIKSDLERLLFANKTIKIDNGSLTAMFDKAGKSMLGGQTEYIIKNILPSENEIIGMIREIKPNSNITNGIELTEAEFNMLQMPGGVGLQSNIDLLLDVPLEITVELGRTRMLIKDVLELVNEQVPILVELKVYEKNYKPLAKKAEEVLSKYIKDKKNIVLISFDPRSLWPFKNKGYIRLLLVAKSDEYTFTWFKRTVEGLDVEKVLFDERRVRRYGKRHFMNCWTIQSLDDINKVKPFADTLTFDTVDFKTIQDNFVK